LNHAVSRADMVLAAATYGFANNLGPHERLLLDEFDKATLATAYLFGRLAPAQMSVG
jgi:hypothetical protein